MRYLATLIALLIFAASAEEAPVIYWNSAAGKTLRARIPPDADYWQLIPNFTTQQTQSYCGVASAITVLNAMPVQKPVDPAYQPYAYYTQNNFFSPAVSQVIDAQTVLRQGMTRDEMAQALERQGVKARSIAGDTLDASALRTLLQSALGDDGQFVLVNFLRQRLGQAGSGHWSVLAAYDAQSDRVLVLDVARFKYEPWWVTVSALQQAMDTLDTTSNKARGLVIVAQQPAAREHP